MASLPLISVPVLPEVLGHHSHGGTLSGILTEKGHWSAALHKRGLLHHDAETGTLVWKDHNEDIP
jgi:hypothetical protein